MTVLEIAKFKAEVTAEFIAARTQAMAAVARTYPGFLSSRLVRFDGDVLADEVVWASMEEAGAAAEGLPQMPEAAAYLALITEFVSMEHAEIVGA
ncbi:hypothetical protein [Nocardioides limicola]|uniref:hypothetical protein n=1 Tax=Nocardioides limicola TaxID=2803368 RepID=UPI00193BE417|nr:hypothetical protein [Nocardioides sp. DJM-14]